MYIILCVLYIMLRQCLDNIIETRNEKVVVFDWNAYIHLYRDIANAGIVSRKQVIWHMIHHGQYNKRLLFKKTTWWNFKEATLHCIS